LDEQETFFVWLGDAMSFRGLIVSVKKKTKLKVEIKEQQEREEHQI
jgi:heme exporter protein D